VDHSDVIEHLQLIFIELPKFPIQSADEKRLRVLWLRFLREIDEKTISVSKDLLAIPEIAQAVALSEESAYTPGELTLYESYWDQISREKTLIMDKYAEGKAEGKAEIAMNMLKDNEPLDRISRFTGLSQDEILKLKLIE
jgi:predicted transposase/invertase (TIGR01784 family)